MSIFTDIAADIARNKSFADFRESDYPPVILALRETSAFVRDYGLPLYPSHRAYGEALSDVFRAGKYAVPKPLITFYLRSITRAITSICPDEPMRGWLKSCAERLGNGDAAMDMLPQYLEDRFNRNMGRIPTWQSPTIKHDDILAEPVGADFDLNDPLRRSRQRVLGQGNEAIYAQKIFIEQPELILGPMLQQEFMSYFPRAVSPAVSAESALSFEEARRATSFAGFLQQAFISDNVIEAVPIALSTYARAQEPEAPFITLVKDEVVMPAIQFYDKQLGIFRRDFVDKVDGETKTIYCAAALHTQHWWDAALEKDGQVGALVSHIRLARHLIHHHRDWTYLAQTVRDSMELNLKGLLAGAKESFTATPAGRAVASKCPFAHLHQPKVA